MNSAANIKTHDGCYHCGLPIPQALIIGLQINSSTQYFCCPACKAVAATIIDGGLGEFYQFRETYADKPDSDSDTDTNTADNTIAIDQQAWQKQFIHRDAQGNYYIELLIGGMHCAACTWLLEKSISKINNVIHVGVSLAENKAIIRWKDTNFSLNTLLNTIKKIGYHTEPFSSSAAKQQQDNERRLSLRRLGIAGLVMMQVGMLAGAMYTGAFDDIVNNTINGSMNNRTADTQWGHWLRWTSMIISLPIIYAAAPIFSGAWRGIKRLQFGMDVSVSIALLLAFIASCYATISGSGEIYFDAVTMFVFLLLASRFLEMQARHYQTRGSNDIRSLLPSTALKIVAITNDKKIQATPISALQIGDEVLVKTGQIIPCDGILISDNALIDESMISGESTPQHKKNGAAIIAGTHNTDQPFHMTLTALPGQLRIDQIAQLTDIAAQTKPHFAQLADRLANYFVIAILGIACLVFFIGWQTHNPFYLANTIAVLVVSCPCALSLAMPTALTIATSTLRRKGLLITASHVWEELDTLTDVIFDKTGTLTTSTPRCAEIKAINGHSDEQIISIIASLESSINHPIAEAFKQQSKNHIAATNVVNTTGSGISGEINGILYRFGKAEFSKPDSQNIPPAPDEKSGWLSLSTEEQLIAWLRIEESLKPEALKIIQLIQSKSLTTHLLSGDQTNNVKSIADDLGIAHWQANAKPEDKLSYLSQLQNDGRRVMMIGDGINDIPIMAQANISLAVNSASELAKLRADAILLTTDLLPIMTLWQATSKTKKIIRQNLLWALLYNVVAIPLAALGLVAPWLAAIGMSASSLIVVGNAWRLRK